MKISPIKQNTNFGYNRNLDKQLKERLNADVQTPAIQTLKQMNNSCNFVEKQLNKLEAKGRSEVDKNELQINMFVDYFVNSKLALCAAVDRLYPDLNYSKRDLSQYKYESNHIKFPKKAYYAFGVKQAYMWREILIDRLQYEIESTTPDTPESKMHLLNELKASGEIEEKKEAEVKPEKPKDMPEPALSGANNIQSSLVSVYNPNEDLDCPKSLDDVVGLNDVRGDVEDLLIFPIMHPDEAIQRQKDYGIGIPNFALLYGPPGCGKTMLAKAIAVETGCTMFNFDLSKIGSSYVNKTSNNIATVFEIVSKIAQKSEKPVILFMDELDSVLKKRRDDNFGSQEDNKSVNTLLPLIASAKSKNILIIGATNMFDSLDPAAKRRVEMNGYIGLPKENEIKEILIKNLEKIEKGKPLAKDDEALSLISKDLIGWSPSNIVNITKDASKNAYRNRREVSKEDFDLAIKNCSYDKIDEEKYMPKGKKPHKKIGFGVLEN